MKSRAYTQLLRVILLISSLFISSLAFAQKDILLYSSDFSDWTPVSYTTDGTSAKSADLNCSGDGGSGFIVGKGSKPEISSGDFCSGNSTSTLTFRPFTFVSGGVVVIDFTTANNGKTLTLSGSGASNITALIESQPDHSAIKDKDTSSVSGATFTSGKNYGSHTVAFSFSGYDEITLVLNSTAKCGEIDINKITVYSTVGAAKYVCSPDYSDAKSDGSGNTNGLTIQGSVGSTTTVSGSVNIKSYNLGSVPVTLSIEGTDAAKFSLPTATIADASTSTPVSVNFLPSVREGISNALLKISAAGANDYYVRLYGVSGSTNPKIVADTATLKFYTYQTGRVTHTIDVSGVNLTDAITATLSDNVNFSVSSSSISLSDATKGTTLTITFTGDINVGTNDATLTLSSTGASSVVIPLSGITSLVKPTMYTMDFAVSPTGTAYLQISPGGNSFLEGSKVKVVVTPETGYKVDHWSDNAGNTKVSREFTISAATPSMVTVYMTKGQQGNDPGTTTGSFVALLPGDISDNSFTSNWTTATNSTNTTVNYTLTVTDISGNIAYSTTTTTTSASVSGLTAGNGYYYIVTSDSDMDGQKTTLKVGPFYTTDSSNTRTCGDDK